MAAFYMLDALQTNKMRGDDPGKSNDSQIGLMVSNWHIKTKVI
jgi:hypothetical protein